MRRNEMAINCKTFHAHSTFQPPTNTFIVYPTAAKSAQRRSHLAA